MADIPAFCLLAFGNNLKYTTQDIIKRWNYITEELRKIKINVINISSDSDPKFNSAMRKNSLIGMGSNLFGNVEWFSSGVQISSDSIKPFHAQDTPHILSKMKNRLLKSDQSKEIYPFGKKYFISVHHIKELIKKIPKDQHQLTLYDLDGTDRQNVSSALRLCSPDVTQLLRKEIPESEGTAKYLDIMHDIVDAFMSKTLKPLERVRKIWYSVFLLRIWRLYVSSNKQINVETNFLTQNCYACVEINAHNLVLMLLFLKKVNMPNLFQPWHFNSQPCESFFRTLRGYSPVYSTVVSCSIKEMLERVKKIQLQNDIAKTSNFDFPRVKRAYESKKLNETTTINYLHDLPTLDNILDQIEQCKKDALNYAIQMKLISKKNSTIELDCKLQASILKKVPLVEENQIEKGPDINFKKINLQNFAAKFIGIDIPEKSQYVRIDHENSNDLVLKKTSLCWLLRPDYKKLSSDRVVRVKTSTK